MEDTKHPGGRPTSYLPEFCDRVIELGRDGLSIVEMAAELGVHRETLEENWPASFPEFSEAFTHARQLSQAWWEKQGRVNLLLPPGAGTFNGSVWSRSMAARFPRDWREKAAVEMSGPDGKPIEHTHTVSDSTGRLLADLSGIGANRQPAPPVSD